MPAFAGVPPVRQQSGGLAETAGFLLDIILPRRRKPKKALMPDEVFQDFYVRSVSRGRAFNADFVCLLLGCRWFNFSKVFHSNG